MNETHSDDLVLYTTRMATASRTNGRSSSPASGATATATCSTSRAGSIWGLDNWIYSTYNAFRIRWTPNGIVREPSGSSGAEWGQSMDDDGRMWFVNSGGERGPVAFQVPIQYGAFNTTDQFEPGFEIVYPAPGIGDMQGGAPRVRMPFNNLNHFTASSAPGDRAERSLSGGHERRSAVLRFRGPADPSREGDEERRPYAAQERRIQAPSSW